MDKIKKLFEKPSQLILAISGIGLVAFYVFYARQKLLGIKKKPQSNSLYMPLKTLIACKDKPNIIKIVVTQSPGNRLQFHGHLITKLKQYLLQNNIHTLVNCSPLKIFDAGVEVFISTLSRVDEDDQKQYMNYFENALQCQLVVQRTIIDIQQIKNKNDRVFIICDTNSLDLKTKSDEKLWNKFLIQKQVKNLFISQINQNDLKNNYNIVFHVMSTNHVVSPKIGSKRMYQNDSIIKTDDQKIKNAWGDFQKYNQISYDLNLSIQENVKISIQYMVKCLKQYLPESINTNLMKQKN